MIYAMQPVGGGAIKLGFTDDLKTRHYHLERRYGTPLAILATMEGGREREHELHEQFAHLRFGRTEQFRPAADLLAFLGLPLLVNANPDAVEAMPVKPTGYQWIRMDDDLCAKAKKLAALRGVRLSELFNSVLKPYVDQEWTKEIRDLKED